MVIKNGRALQRKQGKANKAQFSISQITQLSLFKFGPQNHVLESFRSHWENNQEYV